MAAVKFPEHLIDPREKGKEWHLKMCKSIWHDYDRHRFGSLYHGRDQYHTIAGYMEGRQRIDRYKEVGSSDKNNSASYLNLDYSILAVAQKFIQICMAIMEKNNFNIRADAIDPLAQNENQEWYASKKAEILLREQVGPELSKKLGIAPKKGDAMDTEELDVQFGYTYQHQVSVEMQQIVNGIFRQNNVYKEGRYQIRKNLLYYGVAGWKDYIDKNGKIKVEPVDVSKIITSFCKKRDFSDAVYMGEVLEMSMFDLKNMAGDAFTDEEYIKIAQTAGRQDRGFSNYYQTFQDVQDERVQVMDIEFLTVDRKIYQFGTTRYGNPAVSKAAFNRYGEEYKRRDRNMLYGAKWVVNTDYIFDIGPVKNIKRSGADLECVHFSRHIHAPVFTDMEISSIGGFMKPIIDQIQLDWLKLQQFKANVMPDGFSIEMGALENIPLGQGGSAFKPMDVLELLWQKGTLVYRKTDYYGNDANYKPVEPNVFPGVEKAMGWFDSIQRNMQLLRDVIGLNEFTDGSTPDPKSLRHTAQAAQAGTNNSIYFLLNSEEKLLSSLSESVVTRVKDLADLGYLGRYEKMVGRNSVEFFSASPDIGTRDFGIRLVPQPTDEERASLLEDTKALIGADMVSFEDFVFLRNVNDLDAAGQVLAYRVNKRMERKRKEDIENQQMNAQVQIESANAAEQAKQQTKAVEAELDMRKMDHEKKIRIELMEAEARILGTVTQQRLQTT